MSLVLCFKLAARNGEATTLRLEWLAGKGAYKGGLRAKTCQAYIHVYTRGCTRALTCAKKGCARSDYTP